MEAGTGVGSNLDPGEGAGSANFLQTSPKRPGSMVPAFVSLNFLTARRMAEGGSYAGDDTKRPVSLSYQKTEWARSRPARKMAPRSFAERETTRAPLFVSTRRSPSVGTRRLPGPGMTRAVPAGAAGSRWSVQ